MKSWKTNQIKGSKVKAADFEELKAGLIEVKEYIEGKRELKKTTRRKKKFIATREFGADDIKAIRKKTKLSQSDLADALGVNKKTVQAWEANRNNPLGSSARLLSMFEKKPEIIDDLLEG